jgi:uncharacterized protein (TIGR00725 family)
MTLLLNRSFNRLANAAGEVLDLASRRWTVGEIAINGGWERISIADALAWLQRDSGRPNRVPVAVIGTREATPEQVTLAERLGRRLAEHGVTILCGGRGGVMEAVCRGASEVGGLSIGLLPDAEPEAAHPYVTVPIATGIGVARNALIARGAACVVAIGGGYGTLSEIAFALQFGRPVFVLGNAPVVAGTKVCADVEEAFGNAARVLLGLADESPIP